MSREDIKDCDEYTKGFYDGCTEMGKHFDKLCDTLRETKRALWLARAEKNRLWAIIVDKNPADKVVCFFKQNKRTAMEWYTMLKDNERKCREKAEEYKEGM